ncbi:MAG: hypothetical protein NVS3B7_15860 [Candidatus Elarobacter sp.]
MQIKPLHPLVAALLVGAAVGSASSVSAAPQLENVRGTITSSTASTITIHTASGPVTVHVGPKAVIAGAVPGSPADIVPGKFLGIASVPGSGANRALEVVVFADSMRGLGEGDYPWDLSPGKQRSSMTNGTVAMPPERSTMTNATVGKTSGSAQKTITMNYKGGSRTLLVPANAPVVRVSPGTKALVTAGEPVFVVAAKTRKTPDAAFVVVGRHGTALPM